MLIQHAADFDPALLNVAFIFLFLGSAQGRLARCTPGCPTRTRKGPTPISAVLSGLL